MRAWLSETSITIEGAPDEWQVLLSQLIATYHETQTVEHMWHEFVKSIQEKGAKEKPAASNRRPDLEWYDRNRK
jgi:hypothetical protein